VNIPNLITVGRIMLVPFVVWLIITRQFELAFWAFLIAGISDGVDGFIAKHFDQRTVLGAYLDPLADKALLVSIYVALGVQTELPVWLVIIVVSRDLAIVSAVMLSWVLDSAISMRPLFISKVNTTGQIVLAAMVLGGLGFELEFSRFRDVTVAAVAVLTMVSLVAYLVVWLQHMAGANGESNDVGAADDSADRGGRR